MPHVLCVDFGSTFTKAVLVDSASGELVATASHRTTIGTDLMEALDTIRSRLGVSDVEVRACSSAGGGLRIAVVGNEELITTEAGRRVAMSSGGFVVQVSSGLDFDVRRTLASSPDLVLLVGGTDGGNASVVMANAKALAGIELPVVVAANASCQDDLAAILARDGTPHVVAENVLPEIGLVRPEPARAAIREMFVRHVIGGKQLSRRAEFASLVRGATPDLVLRGVQVLADVLNRDIAVVDIGGATTDVHSVAGRRALVGGDVGVEAPRGGFDVVGYQPVSRTVEGDLGLRWNAPRIVEEAVNSGLLAPEDVPALRREAAARLADPGFVAVSTAQLDVDKRLAGLAITIALRRHAGRDQVRFGPDGRVVERSGKDLRKVGLLLGSGGLLRHIDEAAARSVLADAIADNAGGWLLPVEPELAIDATYVLAAAGLLADDLPDAAAGLAGSSVQPG